MGDNKQWNESQSFTNLEALKYTCWYKWPGWECIWCLLAHHGLTVSQLEYHLPIDNRALHQMFTYYFRGKQTKEIISRAQHLKLRIGKFLKPLKVLTLGIEWGRNTLLNVKKRIEKNVGSSPFVMDPLCSSLGLNLKNNYNRVLNRAEGMKLHFL